MDKIELLCSGYAAGVRGGPLHRGEARHDPDGEGDEEVGEQDVEPYLHSQGVHEGEQLDRLHCRLLPGKRWNIRTAVFNTSSELAKRFLHSLQKYFQGAP